MLNSKQNINFFARLSVLFLSLLLTFVWGPSFAQQEKKQGSFLTLQHILKLIEKVEQTKIIEQVEKSKVDFKLDWRTTAKLVRSGASDDLLEAIYINYYDILRINFKNWSTYGNGINKTTQNNGYTLIINGQSKNWPGCNTISSYFLGNKRTLKVKIDGSNMCNFSDYGKMLKIFGGTEKGTLRCADKSKLSDDPEFLINGDDIFVYAIPESILVNNSLQNLGFVFGRGNIINLMICAWFE